MFYAQQAGNEWSQDVVATAQGGQTAISVTNAGQPLIAYYDWGTQEVKFIQEPAPAGQGCLLLVAAFFKWLMQFRGAVPRTKTASAKNDSLSQIAKINQSG